jgi:hypothetical protein
MRQANNFDIDAIDSAKVKTLKSRTTATIRQEEIHAAAIWEQEICDLDLMVRSTNEKLKVNPIPLQHKITVRISPTDSHSFHIIS